MACMARKLWVVLLVVSLTYGMAVASADESFLDQKLPATWAWCKSPEELLQVLR